MKTPSIKTLARIFADPEKAKEIFQMSRADLENTGPGRDMLMSCFNPPKTYDLRLYVLNAAGGFYGVEAIETTQGEYAEYLNAGDTYTETIIRWRGTYRVQSVGDFVERQRVAFK